MNHYYQSIDPPSLSATVSARVGVGLTAIATAYIGYHHGGGAASATVMAGLTATTLVANSIDKLVKYERPSYFRQ